MELCGGRLPPHHIYVRPDLAAPWSASSSHKGACGGRAARACDMRAASLAAARAGAKGRRRSGRARRLRPAGIGARVWRRRMRRGFGRGESTGLGRHGSGSGWFAPGGQQRPSPCAVRLHQDTGKISNGALGRPCRACSEAPRWSALCKLFVT